MLIFYTFFLLKKKTQLIQVKDICNCYMYFILVLYPPPLPPQNYNSLYLSSLPLSFKITKSITSCTHMNSCQSCRVMWQAISFVLSSSRVLAVPIEGPSCSGWGVCNKQTHIQSMPPPQTSTQSIPPPETNTQSIPPFQINTQSTPFTNQHTVDGFSTNQHTVNGFSTN